MQRSAKNPILTRSNIPAVTPGLTDITSVFNPGAVRFRDKYLLMLRVQNRGRETFFMTAESDNGVNFAVWNEVVQFEGIDRIREKVYHCYDARITELEGRFYVMFAMDMENVCRLGLAQTDDFRRFEFLGIISDGDNRNGVLFPEKIRGRYLRLDRPNSPQSEGNPASGSVIWLSESENLLKWNPVAPLIKGRFHYWDELIGAGPPPIKTREGWLCIYHGIATHFASSSIYQAGVFLLDLEDPSKVIARGRYNILEPREHYELVGQVPNVVFPSGAVAKDTDTDGFADERSDVFIYYGAADTVVGLAMATVKELLAAARMDG